MDNAIILDTETHDIHGFPIQISYLKCSLKQHKLLVDLDTIFDQYFSIDCKISPESMAVHHIIDEDLIGKPRYDTFRLPETVEYIIGHNVYYDLTAIQKCGVDISHLKPICTLALLRSVYPEIKHNLSAAMYFFSEDKAATREKLKNAHSAAIDVELTANILNYILPSLQIHSLEALYQRSQNALIPTHIFFGKYKGTALKNLPPDYVNWLLRQDDLDQFLRIGLENRKVY